MARDLSIHLNARLQPLHRGELFEDPLEVLLTTRSLPAQIVGGGTLTSADGEPLSCDIELELGDDVGPGPTGDAVALIVDALREQGAPLGSTYRLDGAGPVGFGVTEGLALYLNGTELPDEVYAASDVNDLIEAIEGALGAHGAMFSYWQGPRDTALYLYGTSAAGMRALLEPALVPFPLAERCRWDVIAGEGDRN
jgi:hypothetical protein